MSIRTLHERLKVELTQNQPNKHPKIGDNQVLAKNAFSPFNMLAISKTKLEKVGNSEVLGDIYFFSHGKKFTDSLFLYSSKLKIYGRIGDIESRGKALNLIKSGNLSHVENQLKEGLQQEDETELYIPKEITKIIKDVSSKHGKNDRVFFHFKKDGVTVYLGKHGSEINISYPIPIPSELVGKGLLQEGVKSLKSGVWQLREGRVYDYRGEKILLEPFSGYWENKITMPNQHATLKGSIISKMLKFTGNAVNTNNPRDAINYLLLEVANGKGKLIGTDTRRLAVSNEFSISGADGRYHIHPTHLQANPKLIRLSEQVIEIEYADHTYIQQLKHAPMYPEYQRIIPQNMENSFEVETKELEGIKDEVLLAVIDNNLYVQNMKDTDDFNGPVIEDMKPLKTLSINSSNVYVLIDAMFLKDAIDGSEKVTISINNKDLPIMTKGEQGFTIIMPIILKTVREEYEDEMRRKEKKHERKVKEVERKRKERIERTEELERLKEKDGIAHDYLNTLTPMGRGGARKILHRNIRYNRKTTSTVEYIEQLFKDGYHGELKEWKEYSNRLSRRVDKKQWGLTNGEHFIESTKTEAQLLNYLRRTKS